jgi:anti-anti-sigma factor
MPNAHPPYLQSNVDRGVLVLTITRQQIEGEDMAQALRQEMLATVASSGVNKVIIDLQHTLYVSSIAFWPLLALRKELQREGGRLLICGLTGAVKDVFYTTKMVSADGSSGAPFEMTEDVQAALARMLEEPPTS